MSTKASTRAMSKNMEQLGGAEAPPQGCIKDQARAATATTKMIAEVDQVTGGKLWCKTALTVPLTRSY